jgi:abortive infection bacteriophage resistance protein
MRYTKGPLTYAEQLQLLRDRGMQIEDAQRAMRYLERVGYYRLMGYFFPFRKPGLDDYIDGASFERSVQLYEFDRGLRALVLDAISHVEVAVRTSVTYEMAHAYGAFGHCDPANVAFQKNDWHARWIDDVHQETERARETFIDHYRNKYDDFPKLPIWMATEVMSIGTVSKLVKAMHPVDQKRIADRFQLHAPVFSSWLHTIVVVRNICAHHGRFWNRVFGVQPVRPRAGEWQYMTDQLPSDRSFFMLLVLRKLLRSTTEDGEAWRDQVTAHLVPMLQDPGHLLSMGAPKDWENHPLWRAKRRP